MERIGRVTTLQAVLGHRISSPTHFHFTHDGGEVIFNLPNGLQAYYVTNASGFRLDDAPINIVSNPAASDPTVTEWVILFRLSYRGHEDL